MRGVEGAKLCISDGALGMFLCGTPFASIYQTENGCNVNAKELGEAGGVFPSDFALRILKSSSQMSLFCLLHLQARSCCSDVFRRPLKPQNYQPAK